MRILHTADWHLNDRLGRIDRTDDLRRAVERVAAYCASHNVDVLLVAGDLFSELARPDALRETIRHWQAVFAPFLSAGGTVLTLTGNHDNETFCQTLRHAMTLAAPTTGVPGERVSPGRLYLAAEPTLLKLGDVQFVLMPYPTPTRYLVGEAGQRYVSPEEKNKLLVTAFEKTLRELREGPAFDPKLPAVLAAHVHVRGASVGRGLFRLAETDDVLVDGAGLADQYAYVALGHIHKPQCIGGSPHVRYSGSIEAMDLGEQGDAKGVVLFEVGPAGLVGDPQVLPLPSSRVFEVTVTEPADDIPKLRGDHPDAADDLVNLHITYTAGRDSLEEVLRELDGVFPRWYARDWKEASQLGPSLVPLDAARGKGFAETVREYLTAELSHHDAAEVAAVMERADELLKEMG